MDITLPRSAVFRRFAADVSANTAVLFGLSLLPLMLLAGGAVDYQRAMTVKAALAKAADTAALTAARHAALMIGQGESDWSTKSATLGVGAFQSNMRTLTNTAGLAPTVLVTRDGQTVSAKVTFSTSVPTQFLKLAALNNMPVGGTATASTSLPQFANISLVLDVSPSMAIAATAADMTNLKALTQAQTGYGCAFACHDTDSGAPISNYQIARNGGVTLRIDVVKGAAQALSNHVATASAIQSQYTIGLYTLSSSLRTLQPPTSNLSGLNATIGAIDFDRMSVVAPTLPAPAPANLASGNLASHYADTDYATSLSSLDLVVPAQGSGSSTLSRKQFVFLVTDGVSDTGVLYNSAVSAKYDYPTVPNFSAGNDWGKLSAPLDPAVCDALKNRGVQIGILHVAYIADPTDALYQYGVMTNAPPDAVQANLRACASSNLFYEATDIAGITVGLRTLFDNATMNTAARLTK